MHSYTGILVVNIAYTEIWFPVEREAKWEEWLTYRHLLSKDIHTSNVRGTISIPRLWIREGNALRNSRMSTIIYACAHTHTHIHMHTHTHVRAHAHAHAHTERERERQREREKERERKGGERKAKVKHCHQESTHSTGYDVPFSLQHFVLLPS